MKNNRFYWWAPMQVDSISEMHIHALNYQTNTELDFYRFLSCILLDNANLILFGFLSHKNHNKISHFLGYFFIFRNPPNRLAAEYTFSHFRYFRRLYFTYNYTLYIDTSNKSVILHVVFRVRSTSRKRSNKWTSLRSYS